MRQRACLFLLFFCTIVLVSCVTAHTKTIQYGPLGNEKYLVTIVVTTDIRVVEAECKKAHIRLPNDKIILGCSSQLNFVHIDNDHFALQAKEILFFPDILPSDTSLKILAEEHCHTISGFNKIISGLEDPCHKESGGEINIFFFSP